MVTMVKSLLSPSSTSTDECIYYQDQSVMGISQILYKSDIGANAIDYAQPCSSLDWSKERACSKTRDAELIWSDVWYECMDISQDQLSIIRDIFFIFKNCETLLYYSSTHQDRLGIIIIILPDYDDSTLK